MNAMTILRRCRAAETDIRKLDERIDRRREELTSLQAPQADPNGGSRGSGDKDKNGRLLAEIDELERKKADREDEQQAERSAALTLVEMVPDLEGRVLYLYYAKKPEKRGEQWDTGRIARKEHLTPGYVRKVKRNAEQLLDMVGQDLVDATLPAWYLERRGDG